jgi:hypothetical protein
MTSYSQKIQNQLLNLMGAQPRRTFGDALLSAAIPAAAGAMVGGIAALLLAPKAGYLVRKDMQQWLATAREQDLKTTVKKTLDSVRSSNGHSTAVELGDGDGRNTR